LRSSGVQRLTRNTAALRQNETSSKHFAHWSHEPSKINAERGCTVAQIFRICCIAEFHSASRPQFQRAIDFERCRLEIGDTADSENLRYAGTIRVSWAELLPLSAIFYRLLVIGYALRAPVVVSFAEAGEKAGVSGGEGVKIELRAVDPCEGLAPESLRLVRPPEAAEKAEVNPFLRILVGDRFDQLACIHFNAQFLLQLPLQANFEGFIRFTLSAGEFPKPAQMPSLRALGDQKLARSEDKAC
jgi:hypothetical protein